MKQRNGWWLIAALILSLDAFGADDEQRLSAEVLWSLERVGPPVISPDGAWVVVPVTTFDEKTDEAATRLWLLDAEGRSPQRPLTAEGLTASEPVFSPDGRRLAFVSQRDEDDAGQIYLLPMDTPGEAVRLTALPTGVSGLRWVGDHLYFMSWIWPDTALDRMGDAVKADAEDKVSAMVWNHLPYSHWDHYLDEARERHLFRIPAAGGEMEALTVGTGLALPRGEAGAGDYDVAPDERALVFVADSAAGEVYPNFDLYRLDLDGKAVANLTPDNPAGDTAPRYSPDGRQLAFDRRTIPGFYGDQARLMLRDMATGRTRRLHGEWDRSLAGLAWRPDGQGFYGAVDDAGTHRFYAVPLDGAPRPLSTETDYDAVAISDNGRLVARNQGLEFPPRVVLLDPLAGTTTRLDRFNDERLAEVALGRRESVTYTGADGEEIQMWVQYPPGFDPDKRYPLMMLIHGGPHGAVTDVFHYRWNAQTFASWGYVTAWPNFHGSSGFGQAFTDSINPDWVSRPYEDVIAATRWLMDQDWIDEDRVVAAGGSYGGYLSTILLGKPHPFKTLVIHAAVYDLYAQMASDFTVHGQRFGEFWEVPEIYRALSPHYQAGKFETPSLIIHGQQDLRVPVGQAFELFRTLQSRGVESRLVYYPDENHFILKRSNSIHWYGEIRDWIARFAPPGPR